MAFELAMALLIFLIVCPPIMAFITGNAFLWVFWLAFIALIIAGNKVNNG